MALASYPRSGNTWMRFLLENATGRKSGSIYRDRVLRRGQQGIVIKTHALDSANYARAIHMVRRPLDAIESHYFWKKDIRGKSVEWDEHIRRSIIAWREHTEHWLAAACPTLLIRYEDLHADTCESVRQVLKWLGYEATEDMLRRAVEQSSIENLRRSTAGGDRFFRRGTVGQSLSSYEPDQSAMAEEQLGFLLDRLGYSSRANATAGTYRS